MASGGTVEKPRQRIGSVLNKCEYLREILSHFSDLRPSQRERDLSKGMLAYSPYLCFALS